MGSSSMTCAFLYIYSLIAVSRHTKLVIQVFILGQVKIEKKKCLDRKSYDF